MADEKGLEIKFDLLDKRKVDDAISFICRYFDEQGLTLYERWHVCHSIDMAAIGIMNKNAQSSK